MEGKRREREENINKIDLNRWGLRVKLVKLSGIRTFETITVVVGVFLDNKAMYDDLGELMVYSTNAYPYKKARKKSAGAKAPPRIVKFTDDAKMEFIKNVKGLILLNKGVRKVYLGFKIILTPRPKKKEEEKEIKLDDDDEENPLENLPSLPEPPVQEVTGWYYWEVSKANGDIKSSAKKRLINMYNAPMLVLPFKKGKLKKSPKKLEFICQKIYYEPASLPFIAEMRIKERPKKEKQKNIKIEKFDKVYNEPFVRNVVPNWENRPFDKGSGIDIYIDGCRFLPDNVTVTKIIVRVIDSEFNDFVDPQAGLPELDSDILNPIFNYRDELRFPNYDPTLMLYITYLTFDSRGVRKTPQIMGYSLFNLFIKREDESQPKKRSEMPYALLQTGYYQIPIYCQEIDPKERPFFVDDVQKYDKLPGATTLIRIRFAPVSDDGTRILGIHDIEGMEQRALKGVWVPPPKYNTGAYNNRLCNVGQTEEDLINTRVDRKPITAQENSYQMMEMLGVPPPLGEQLTERDKSDAIIEFLDEYLILRSDSPYLNLKYFSKYRGAGGGFKVSIDGIFNLPSKGYYFCMYSMNPPGEYYSEQGLSGRDCGLRVNTFFDWAKTTSNVVFYNEGYVKYGEIPFNPTLSLIVDIRRFQFTDMGEGLFTKEAWTIVPIFTVDEYVNSNIYQIPLFKGSPTKEILQSLEVPEPWNVIEKLVATRTLKYWGKASIFCRLIDLQREGHFQFSFDYKRCVTDLLPEKLLKSYLFTEKDEKRLKKATKLESTLRFGEPSDSFNTRMSMSIIKEYAIGESDGESEDEFDEWSVQDEAELNQDSEDLDFLEDDANNLD